MDKYYEAKGYTIPRVKGSHRRLIAQKDFKINVKTTDLPNGSSVKVNVKCDECGKISYIKWADYKEKVKENGLCYCHRCANKLYASNNTRINKLKKGLSFEQWCLKNNRQDILNRWDYNLNKYKPNEISHSTHIKCWLKCPNGIHSSELKDINGFTAGQNGSVDCKKCNSFGQWILNNYGRDTLNKLWCDKNILNPFEIDRCSDKKVYLKCLTCGNEKLISLNLYVRQGMSCPCCGDGISYGEKFVFSLLKQLGIDFIYQLTSRTRKWCKGTNYNYRYDFYLTNSNTIIEVNGMQHYKETYSSWGSLADIQMNDKLKRKIAIDNGVCDKNYIIIDCQESSINHIKSSIINSRLNELFDLSSINWIDCQKYAYCGFVKICSTLWNCGSSILEISNNFKRSRPTIIRYLKKATELGWCYYNSNEEQKNNYKNKYKKVYCKELNKTFKSIAHAERELNISNSSITACCKGKAKSAGKGIGGIKLTWSYV